MSPGLVHRRYVDAPFGQLHVTQAGTGPTVLCLHQTPRSWDEFREIIALLAADFHLVAIDLPGMGASDPLGGTASIEAYANAGLIVADALDIDRFHVLGHHTGGVVGIALAATTPERVASLMLSSTPWVDEQARVARGASPPPVDTATPADDGTHLTELWNKRRRYYPPGHTLLNRYMIDVLRSRDGAEGHLAVGRYEMERAATRVECPVLVIEHTEDPFSARYTTELAEHLNATTIVRIDRGSIPLEHSAADVAAAVREFISSL